MKEGGPRRAATRGSAQTYLGDVRETVPLRRRRALRHTKRGVAREAARRAARRPRSTLLKPRLRCRERELPLPLRGNCGATGSGPRSRHATICLFLMTRAISASPSCAAPGESYFNGRRSDMEEAEAAAG
ncbi:hypothetical protein MTO96_013810 [Rhipicephalus appendiculatus]